MVVDPKDIKWAWLIIRPQDKDCTEVIKKMREKNINFEMIGLCSGEKRPSTSEMVKILLLHSGKNAKLGMKLKPPILVLDHSKINHCMEIIILVGRKNIINTLRLRPN